MERPVGGEHAMAGDDDRVRVAAQRGADGAGRARRSDRPRDLAVGGGRARADRAGGGVDRGSEGIELAFVERDLAQVALFAGEQRDDAGDAVADRGRQVGGARPAERRRAAGSRASPPR